MGKWAICATKVVQKVAQDRIRPSRQLSCTEACILFFSHFYNTSSQRCGAKLAMCTKSKFVLKLYIYIYCNVIYIIIILYPSQV